MTDRKPDFYRIVRVSNGRRLYLGADEFHWFGNDLFVNDHQERQILSYTHKAAAAALSRLSGCYPARIVPVYVKVTRKPKLHDFAWALKRMREGKRVRRASWGDAAVIRDGKLVWASGSNFRTITDESVLATDWQEAP